MKDTSTKKQIISPQAQNSFHSTRVLKILVASIFCLSVISTFLSYLKFQVIGANKNLVNIFLTFFSLDREKNIPTYFSSFILLCSSLLLLLIFFYEGNLKERKFYWASLSLIFLILSMDELVGFHEFTAGPIVENYELSGFLYMGWVIPAIFVVVVLGLFFLRFLRSLNPTTRNQFVISGLLYVGGAVGLEMVGGYFVDKIGVDNFPYALIANIEETVEMLGIAFFIYSLLNYIRLIIPHGFNIRIKK